jgi:hypothetical protein
MNLRRNHCTVSPNHLFAQPDTRVYASQLFKLLAADEDLGNEIRIESRLASLRRDASFALVLLQ